MNRIWQGWWEVTCDAACSIFTLLPSWLAGSKPPHDVKPTCAGTEGNNSIGFKEPSLASKPPAWAWRCSLPSGTSWWLKSQPTSWSQPLKDSDTENSAKPCPNPWSTDAVGKWVFQATTLWGNLLCSNRSLISQESAVWGGLGDSSSLFNLSAGWVWTLGTESMWRLLPPSLPPFLMLALNWDSSWLLTETHVWPFYEAWASKRVRGKERRKTSHFLTQPQKSNSITSSGFHSLEERF